MRRQHTTPDAYGTDLLRQQWRKLVGVTPTGPAAAALHTRSVSARAILAYAAARRSVDDLINGAYEGRLFPDGDAWAFGELARVVALQGLFAQDRPDSVALFDSLMRTFGAAGVAPEHQGLHAQMAFVTGDRARTAKLLADYPEVPDSVRTALTVDMAEPDEWLRLFTALLPGPAPTLQGDAGPRFDRLCSGRPRRLGSAHRISSVVTTYQPGLPLLTTIRSLVAQSWTNHEILVVDDGSGPAHEPFLARAAALNPRVRIVALGANGGTYRARNAGLDLATGEFVTFQDSDDWSHPLRLEKQVAPLLADDALVATTSAGMRVTEDLVVTRPGFADYRSYNLSSLMIRREAALTRLGYLDTVRKGADAEYVERARAVFGRPAVLHLGGEPLALIRLSPGSLSGADITPGWMHPARWAYMSAFQSWHARVAAGKADPVRPSTPTTRAFTAPRRLAGDAADRRAGYDVILAADWSAHGDVAWPVGERLRALTAPGRSIAVLHLDLLTNVAHRPGRLDADVQEMINSGEVDQLVLDDSAQARLVVAHGPALLGFAPGYQSGIRAERVVIEADPAWGEAVFHCEAEARRLFGVEPWWAPAGPAERTVLAGGPFGTRLAAADLPGTLNADRWRLHRTGPRADRPVIGRLMTDRPGVDSEIDWRRLHDMLAGAEGLDIRFRAPAGPAQRPPRGWLIYGTSDVDTRGFLHQLDFYLHLPADTTSTAVTPELLVALAAGCVLVLPRRYAPVFGPAAIYCEPGEVAATVRKLYQRPDAVRAQSTRGLDFVRGHHGHDRYANAVTALVPQPE